ncbi:MAG: ATP-binding cassette domain-containing protein [Actinomycetota bacterium]
MGSTNGIEARGLAKSYDSGPALCGLDLDVPPASVFALLGPNGAGKTTAVRILATLTRADSGSARVAGFDVATESRQVRRRISFTGQFAGVDEPQTGEENLRMMARLCGLNRRDARNRARDLLAQFDLADVAKNRVATYSGGMRRRLDLAAGLVGRPAVLFLDEPTTGLDPRSRQAMWVVLEALVKDGATVLLTTQYLEEADRLAHRMAMLDHGSVVAEGTPAELKARVGRQRLVLRAAHQAAYDDLLFELATRVIEVDPAGLSVSVATDGAAAAIRSLLDEVDPLRGLVARFAVRAPSLDDVFLALTGRGAQVAAQDV